MSVRVLAVACHDPRDLTNGMGLVVGHTLAQLSRLPDVVLSVGLIRPELPARRLEPRTALNPSVPRVFDIIRPNPSRSDLLRAVIGKPLSTSEKRALDVLPAAAAKADVVLWIGYSWDLLAQIVPDCSSGRPVVLHCNDSIALFEQNRAVGRLGMLRVSAATSVERRVMMSGYRGVVFVSAVDAGYAASLIHESRQPKFLALPNGVDAEWFSPAPTNGMTSGPAQPCLRVLLTGVMNYEPNVIAARRLMDEILPLVQFPVQVRIAGRDPAPELIAAARRDARVTVVGSVENMADEYRDADVLVLPLEKATGTKNKVLEALACGIPVLTTPAVLAAFPSGMPGTIAVKQETEFVQAMAALAADPQRRMSMGRDASAYIAHHWSWTNRTRRMMSWIQDLL